jgi:hypothetical protein
MRRLSILWLVCAGLTGCDSDGDGISDAREHRLGTDPDKADSDGDGLDDLVEVDLGTDPTKADTDGDGLDDLEELDFGTDPLDTDTDDDGLSDGEEYELGSDGTLTDSDGDSYHDYDEVTEGTDPADPDSRIYNGYWPYNRDKDLIDGPMLGYTVEEGDIFGRLTGPDQFGDTVDLYDFAGQGKYTMLMVAAGYCSYSNEFGRFFMGRPSSTYGDQGYDVLVDRVADGTLQWITILFANDEGDRPTQADAAEWYDTYPLDHVPVIADEDQRMDWHLDLYGTPEMVLLDETMTIVAYDREDYGSTLDRAVALVGGS